MAGFIFIVATLVVAAAVFAIARFLAIAIATNFGDRTAGHSVRVLANVFALVIVCVTVIPIIASMVAS